MLNNILVRRKTPRWATTEPDYSWERGRLIRLDGENFLVDQGGVTDWLHTSTHDWVWDYSTRSFWCDEFLTYVGPGIN